MALALGQAARDRLNSTNPHMQQVVAWSEERQESKYSQDLLQLNNGVKIPPTGHKCMRCELTENLWLNLTDGAMLCGRKNFDGMHRPQCP